MRMCRDRYESLCGRGKIWEKFSQFCDLMIGSLIIGLWSTLCFGEVGIYAQTSILRTIFVFFSTSDNGLRGNPF